MKTRLCRCGAIISVDDDVSDDILNLRWHCNDQKGMVQCLVNQRHVSTVIFLVHQVMPHAAPVGFEWDHKDYNKHNNLRSNLRLATRSQNMANRPAPKQNSSGYKGVRWHNRRSKWQARITVNYKEIHLGYFDNIEEAAVAYNNAAMKFFGEFAYLNVLPWPNSVFQGPPKQSDIPLPMMQITP